MFARPRPSTIGVLVVVWLNVVSSPTINAHISQMALHGDQNLTRRVYLRLKCVVRSHVSFNLFLDQLFIFSLQKWLLSVPKVCKLVLCTTARWACHIKKCSLFVSWMWISSTARFIWRSCSCWPRSSFVIWCLLLVYCLLLLLYSMIIKSLIAFDVLLLLGRLCNNSGTLFVYRGLKLAIFILISIIWWRLFFTASDLLLMLFNGLLVEWFPVLWSRRLRLLSFFQYAFTMFARFGLKLTFFLNLSLDFSLFKINELLFTFKVFGYSFVPRFESLAHFLWLSTHGFGLESTAWLLLDVLLLLQINHFFTRLFWIP